MENVTAEAFSYAELDDPFWKRSAIRLVERATGQPYLHWLYRCARDYPIPGENFWDAAIRLMELQIAYDEEKLQAWPKTGPLVVVCNHPFGVLDGAVACHIVGKVRPDFKVLTNAVICRAEELRPYLLPIDFTETRAAMKTNMQSRNAAKEHVAAGGCLLIFPSGAVSTAPGWFAPKAVDPEWKTFTAGMIAKTHAPVAPLYFAGQNSRLFQWVSQFSLTLRLSLLFHEVHNKLGSTVQAGIGRVIPYEELAPLSDRARLMAFLREETYALAETTPEPLPTRAKRPRCTPRPGTAIPGIG